MTHLTETAAAAECASCRQPIAGRYCPNCGEKTVDPHALTVRHFLLHTVVHELFHLDGKLWQTFRLLFFRPGFLSQEYCAGRRKPYVNPFRLLITAIIVYAFLASGGLRIALFIGPVRLSVAPTGISEGSSIAETAAQIDRLGILEGIISEMDPAVLQSEGARVKFHSQLHRFAQPLSFTNVLLLGILLYILFHRKRRFFVEHGVFAMHLMSFVLLSALLFLPAPHLMAAGVDSTATVLILLVTIWQFAYLAAAIGRFYPLTGGRLVRGSLAATISLLIYVLNSLFITVVQLAGGALALWTI